MIFRIKHFPVVWSVTVASVSVKRNMEMERERCRGMLMNYQSATVVMF